MFSLQPPRHISTLPIVTELRCPRYVRLSLNLRHACGAANDAPGQEAIVTEYESRLKKVHPATAGAADRLFLK